LSSRKIDNTFVELFDEGNVENNQVINFFNQCLFPLTK